MSLNVSVVLIFTLLALTEDVASPQQQPQKVHRIGWIAFNGSRPPRDFMIGLRERGYVEGQSIVIEYRSAQGSEKRLSEIAAELVRLKPEVIVANGNDATDAARKATTTIPIVFEHGDPIWDGVAGSLAQPGKNLTGLSEIAFELAGKRLELLRDAFPKISHIAVLLDPNAPVHRRQFADMEKVAQSLGVQLQAVELRDLRLDFDAVLQRPTSQRANAFLTLPNPNVFRHRTRRVGVRGKKPAAGNIPGQRVCQRRRAYVLWRGLPCFEPTRRLLCRQDFKRSEAVGSAGGAADEV